MVDDWCIDHSNSCLWQPKPLKVTHQWHASCRSVSASFWWTCTATWCPQWTFSLSLGPRLFWAPIHYGGSKYIFPEENISGGPAWHKNDVRHHGENRRPGPKPDIQPLAWWKWCTNLIYLCTGHHKREGRQTGKHFTIRLGWKLGTQ